jgi:Queuosine biosynthesis protein QueC
MKSTREAEDAIPSAFIDVCESGARARSATHTCKIGRDLKINLHDLSRFCLVELQPLEDDLLVLAGSVAFADKVVPRHPSVAWRRKIHVRVPVNEPNRWNEPKLHRILISTLDYVTGDLWEFSFKPRIDRTKVKPQPLLAMPSEASLVMPFSDGLDSYAVARLVAADNRNTPLILVTTGRHRNRVLDRSNAESGGMIHRIAIPFTLSSRYWRVRFRESSYRSRAFAFGVVAGIAAHQLCAKQIYVSESGQGSLGPWLSPVGNEAPDVRMHPSFTARLSLFLNELFGTSISHLHPRLWHTKSETLKELNDRGLAGEWWRTWSCARDQRHVFLDKKRIQCGVCEGCLLRRQSVHAAGLQNDTEQYLWNDLRASTLNQATLGRATRSNDEHQAQCAVLEMDQFGRISRDAERIAIAAEELSPFVYEDAGLVATRLQRLITAHATEWHTFLSALGPQSFVNQWLDVLR